MNIREISEQNEHQYLSPFAAKSDSSKGRKETEVPCDIRTDYQRDRDRIIHSKAFRRLKHKTQVFISPEGDHYRTRLTHTLEVAQISRTMAKALMLNEDLVEAIALGHDLGHTPFGHTGEMVLNQLNPKGFKHNEHSLRIVDFLEKRKNNHGLNLTEEVRDGILQHTGSGSPMTLEGQLVQISDRIAYLNHDIDDSIRAGILCESNLPHDCLSVLGYTHGQRISTMIRDVIECSKDQASISRSQEVIKASEKLREFMFEAVYYNKNAKKEEDKAKKLIELLFKYYCENFHMIPDEYKMLAFPKEDIVTYYIAGMSDRYAIGVFNNIYVPASWKVY